jgi:hypothetical protein
VMFGDADRKKASDALATIVERMQLEFKISDNPRIKNSSTEVD